MHANRALMDRMIADRAARNRRNAFWNDRAAQMRSAAARRTAANDAHAPAKAV